MALPPLIEALLRRSQYGVSKINARGSAISSALEPFASRVGSYYAPLQAQEQAIGSAVSGSLTAQGQQLGSSITSSLQGIQAPQAAIQQFGAGTATTGAQSGAAVGALSSADLQRLQSQGSAEQIYAAALPRLAMLAADQDRRAFLADAAQELSDLSAQQAQVNVENQRYAAEQARQAKQDRIERSRYRTEQRQKQKALRYQRQQDTRDRKRQATLDRLAQQAAAAEYGLSYTNTMTDNQRAAASAAESARHNRATEAAARAREARQAAKDKAAAQGKGKGGGEGTKFWDSTRDDVFRRAQAYGKSYNPNAVLKKNRGVDKATARARLWAEFGTLLTDRGFERKAVNTLISRALAAAGY